MPVRAAIKRVYSLFYFAQIPMAFSSALFLWTCTILLGRHLPFPWYVAAFAGTWAIYIHDATSGHSEEDRINSPLRYSFFARNPWIAKWPPLIALLISGAAVFATAPPERVDLLILLLALAAALYTLTLIPTSRGKLRLKDLGSIKAWAVSLAWLVGGIGIPFVSGIVDHSPAVSPFMISHFLFILLMIDTVALDWRDIYGDRGRGILTLAVILGDRTPPMLQVSMILAALIWLAGLNRSLDARWLLGGGTMLLTLAGPIFLIRRIREKVLFGTLILLWRLTGPLALFLITAKKIA